MFGCLDLPSVHLPLSTTDLPEAPSGLKASLGALHDQFPLHLCQRGHHMEEEPSCRSRGVDLICEAGKVDLLFGQVRYKIDQALH